MAKISNVQLTAERRAIAELLAEYGGKNNLERLKACLLEHQNHVQTLLAKNRALTDELSALTMNGSAPAPAEDMPVAEPGLVPTTRYPLDAAQYPKPGTYREPVLTGPQMSPIEGDLTPSFVRWFMSQNGPQATKEKYGDRIPLLPDDVRRVLV